jgi:hypothetical protein
VTRPSCLFCGKENAEFKPPQANGSAILAASADTPGVPAAAATPAADAQPAQAGPVRVPNMYAAGGYLWRCPRGHVYSAPGDCPPCPDCHRGVMTFFKNQGRPPGGLGGGFGGGMFPGGLR